MFNFTKLITATITIFLACPSYGQDREWEERSAPQGPGGTSMSINSVGGLSFTSTVNGRGTLMLLSPPEHGGVKFRDCARECWIPFAIGPNSYRARANPYSSGDNLIVIEMDQALKGIIQAGAFRGSIITIKMPYQGSARNQFETSLRGLSLDVDGGAPKAGVRDYPVRGQRI